MKKKHETSTIDGFFDRFKEVAGRKGKILTRCSTDGQDSILGADYIFTNNTRFVLAEFKYEEDDLESERKKWRRLKLCKILDEDLKRRQQSLKCHYVAWSIKKHYRSVGFSKYYSEICNSKIFGEESGLIQVEPSYEERKSADKLIDDFLSDRIGATYKLFEVYTNWLMALEGEGAGSVELMLNNPDSEQLQLIDFGSVYELKTWLDYNAPRQKLNPPSTGFDVR